MSEHYRVKPGSEVRMREWDPDDDKAFPECKEDACVKLDDLRLRLEKLQAMLYAEHKNKLLIVLQGMDTAGKDGTIRHVFEGLNPQWVTVAPFKVPTIDELDHDFLWRIHKQVPGKGQMTVFNRSHYEDVLVVRVKNLVPEHIWKKRYQSINDFERMLCEEGTTIIKFYLNISKEEQRKRLQERIDDPNRRWKFSLGDLKERERWHEYMKAYEDAISKTSTEYAPWYMVPSNKKWYRNYVVASVMVKALEDMNLKYPKTDQNLEGLIIK
jgi:PPK2 family polyphosphate:nucleotide phosphotransferase